jgi:hypothetical protein
MEEKTSSTKVSSETTQAVPTSGDDAPTSISSTPREAEHRQSYGTAKTENLQDSGLWRTILPVVVVIFCLTLIVVPLVILIPLLSNSIVSASIGGKEGGFIWLWIVMIVLELAICAVIIKGLTRIFMTQAGNYS